MGKASPAGDSSSLFEFLDHTHREIQQQLQGLRELMDTMDDQGLTPATRALATQALDYFNGAARQHHLDEEKHVFPALLGSQNPQVIQVTEQLVQDHGWLEENWLEIEPSISAVASGNLWFEPAALRQALTVFEALYLDHMQLEESVAYPEAQRRLLPSDAAGAGREMAKRRNQATKHP